MKGIESAAMFLDEGTDPIQYTTSGVLTVEYIGRL